MKKIYFLFALLFLLFFGLIGFSKVSADEFESSANLTQLEQYQAEEWGNQLEYIFNYMYSEDSSGKFVANVDNIENSPYTDEERYQIALFVAYVNGEEVTTFRSSSWFERCLRDTYRISKPSIDAIVRDVKRKDFWSAGSKLFTAIKGSSAAASHPKITIAIAVGYLSLCGAQTVS